MKILPVFPTPFGVSNIDIDTTKLLKIIESFEYHRFETQTASYTTNKRILQKEELKDLRQKFEEKYNNFIYDQLGFSREIEFRITTSWVVKLEPGDYTHAHYHAHSMFSCVFYLDVDNDSGAITFYRKIKINELGGDDPLFIIPVSNSFNYNEYNSPSWRFNPIKNDFIIFPSNINHEVAVNKSNKTRYSLAFNLFPSGSIGIQEFGIELEIK